MRIARSKCLPMPWTRAGVRLIPKGHSANRSLSAIGPVSATAKRKLENGEQRPVPETYPARAEIPKITGQRLGSASVTRGNAAGSHTLGKINPETRLPGCPQRIRTQKCNLELSHAHIRDEESCDSPGGQFPARRSKFPARLKKFPVRRELIPCFIL